MAPILSQSKLIAALRAQPDPIRVGPLTIHRWIRSGMPTVKGWASPRFTLPAVLSWLESTQAHDVVDPLELQVRDRLLAKRVRRRR